MQSLHVKSAVTDARTARRPGRIIMWHWRAQTADILFHRLHNACTLALSAREWTPLFRPTWHDNTGGRHDNRH